MTIRFFDASVFGSGSPLRKLHVWLCGRYRGFCEPWEFFSMPRSGAALREMPISKMRRAGASIDRSIASLEEKETTGRFIAIIAMPVSWLWSKSQKRVGGRGHLAWARAARENLFETNPRSIVITRYFSNAVLCLEKPGSTTHISCLQDVILRRGKSKNGLPFCT